MGPERIELSRKERSGGTCCMQVEERQIQQGEVARRQRSTGTQVRRLHVPLCRQGDRGVVYRSPRRRSTRKMSEIVVQPAAGQPSQSRYDGFDLKLASRHLVGRPMRVSGEPLRQWMIAVGLWWQRRWRVEGVYLRRARLGELGTMGSSPRRWLGERLFAALQDRLVRQARLRRAATLEVANRFRETTHWPVGPFAKPAVTAWMRIVDSSLPAPGGNSECARSPSVAEDHAANWQLQDRRCTGSGSAPDYVLRGARAEIERRLKGSHRLRFRGCYVPLSLCSGAPAISDSFQPASRSRRSSSPNQDQNHYLPPAVTPGGRLEADISTWQKTGQLRLVHRESCDEPGEAAGGNTFPGQR